MWLARAFIPWLNNLHSLSRTSSEPGPNPSPQDPILFSYVPTPLPQVFCLDCINFGCWSRNLTTTWIKKCARNRSNLPPSSLWIWILLSVFLELHEGSNENAIRSSLPAQSLTLILRIEFHETPFQWLFDWTLMKLGSRWGSTNK
jgi:hypothetical protein